MSGEVHGDLADAFRAARNEVVAVLNEAFENKDYGPGLTAWDLIPIILPKDWPLHEEVVRYSKRTKETEFRLHIDFDTFKNASPAGQRILICNVLRFSLTYLEATKVKDVDFASLRADFEKAILSQRWTPNGVASHSSTPKSKPVAVRQNRLAKNVAVPERIKINREEDYHTHFIGTYGGKPGTKPNQFMGFVTATLPEPMPKNWEQHKRWYAVLHTFDADGNHLKSDAWFAGVTADGETQVTDKAGEQLAEMLRGLGKIKFGNVIVRLFSVKIDGQVFGLIDASEADEDIVSVHLVPNDLALFAPWDGEYYT